MSTASLTQAVALERSAEPTILVVDDSPIDRRLVGAILDKAAGWQVHFASDGVEALSLVSRHSPNAIVTDLQMPGMDGLELVEEIRSKFPLVPVVLMTAHGSEDIAIQALQKGAASYVPKRSLKEDLIFTLESVLAVADVEHRRRKIMAGLESSELRFRVENDPGLISPLVMLLQENLMAMKLCDETGRIRIGIALEESLVNAMHHGNLEVGSELRRAEGDQPYQALLQARRRQSPYRERRVDVYARISRDEAVFRIQDQGPGFDVAQLPNPTDPANLDRPSGRGLLLIKTFMDEVEHNATGNEITMVKRRELNAC
jgi:CheY-like chemotaxis protein